MFIYTAYKMSYFRYLIVFPLADNNTQVPDNNTKVTDKDNRNTLAPDDGLGPSSDSDGGIMMLNPYLESYFTKIIL